MRDHVTVIPSDSLIMVGGTGLVFAFPAPDTLHALQWHGGAGHREIIGEANQPLTADDYAEAVAPYVALWEAEKQRRDEEASRSPTLPEAKAAKVAAIDTATSRAITAGFAYEVEGTAYHFSYDAFDQQNFADSATVASLLLGGAPAPGMPISVTWNAYTLPEKKLTRLTFTPSAFLGLYTQGALVHKATQMELGGLKKAAVEAAATLEEVAAVQAATSQEEGATL